MAKGFKGLIIAMALTGLVMFCLINFAIQTASDNNANQSIIDNPVISRTFANLSDDMSGLEAKAQEQRENIEGDKISTGLGFFILETIIGGGRVFTGIVIGTFNIISEPLVSVIGIPVSIMGVLSFILLVSLILFAWRLYKVGE